MEFKFEQPKNHLSTNARAEIIQTPEEMLGQLEASFVRYSEALEELRGGNNDNLDYLDEMQQNLLAWKNRIIEIGVSTPEQEEIARQINARLFELSEELQKFESSR